ncbi:MAG: hypothetical protein HC877_05975 [Thioploca sp.]|nr:hypothetical protein [Thioploca sp.]
MVIPIKSRYLTVANGHVTRIQLSQLNTLDLCDNPLEGTLPKTLGELMRLENLYLGVDNERKIKLALVGNLVWLLRLWWATLRFCPPYLAWLPEKSSA